VLWFCFAISMVFMGFEIAMVFIGFAISIGLMGSWDFFLGDVF